MIEFIMFCFGSWWTAIIFVILFATACNYIVSFVAEWLKFFGICIRGQPLTKTYYYNKQEDYAEGEDGKKKE